CVFVLGFILCCCSCHIVLPTVVSVDFFFFSSRRRHTRFSRDWSSDVCSSDLMDLILGRPSQMVELGSRDPSISCLRGSRRTRPRRAGVPGPIRWWWSVRT